MGIPGWTMQHGFFVVMGGIHLVEPVEEKSSAQAMTILTKEMLKALKPDIINEIKDLKVTEEEIAHTSKGDALSKAIFIFQSSWFVMQCIARVIEGLALTQLELTTLALASLNGITLILWWEKPLGAQTVVRVYLKRKLSFTEKAVAAQHGEKHVEVISRGHSYRSKLFPNLHAAFRAAVVLIRDLVLRRPSDHIYVDWFVGLPWAILTLLLFPANVVVSSCLYNLGDVVMGGSTSFPYDATHVPPAYAPKHSDYSQYAHPFLMMVLATVFGSIHCAGWNLLFPTHQERKLWRLASLSVTIIPPVLIIVFFVIRALLVSRGFYSKSSHNITAGLAAVSFAIMYVAARFVIVGQAIAFLTHQPPSAFTAVDWSKFYPHLF
jgi:hypothetical protein